MLLPEQKPVLNRFFIAARGDKMGVIDSADDSVFLPFEYDNIFIYGTDIFVVHKKGKIGAVRIVAGSADVIAKCKYDTVEAFECDLVFCRSSGVRYYNAAAGAVWDFKDITSEPPFLYCTDEKYQYILCSRTGRVIYKKEYMPKSLSYFCFCGDTDKGPVFYDARYSTFLYPAKEGYKIYDGIFNSPIVINRQNSINITQGEDGIGVIDSCGGTIFENRFDKITVELKITATSGGKREQKIIPIFKNPFENEDCKATETWI